MDPNKTDFIGEEYGFPESHKNNISIVLIFIVFFLTLIVLGWYFFNKNAEGVGNILQDQSEQDIATIKDDPIFNSGFTDTGREWPPIEKSWSQELKDNPLVKLREDYCNRVGYKYADFGGDCFVYQYYDSHKSYINKDKDFYVYFPMFWQIDSSSFRYDFVESSEFSMQRDGASCAIFYGKIDKNSLYSYNNASTTSIIFYEDFNLELEEIVLPFDRNLTSEERAAGYVNKRVVAVPNFPHPSSEYGFLLTSGDRQPLSEACVDEFENLILQRGVSYPEARITHESNGILTFGSGILDFEGGENGGPIQNTILLFKDLETGVAKSVIKNPPENDLRHSSSFVSGGKIYFMTSEPNYVIRSSDIFSGQDEVLSLNYDENRPIHDFFVRGDSLYYLSGKYCNGYRDKCEDITLTEYNLKTGANDILSNGLSVRRINGFDITNEKLILSWSDGDAGCGWGQYWALSLSDLNTSYIGEFSHCFDDPEDTLEPFRNLVVGLGVFKYLIIENGNIYYQEDAIDYSGFRIDTNEYSHK